MRRSVLLGAFLGALILGWLGWRWLGGRNPSSPQQTKETSAPIIVKQPVVFASRTFDPAAPPPDMPPLAPGEAAQCDSDFVSNVSVGGQPEPTDATHALVTITQVKMELQLNITIWVPVNAAQHVIEHEEGHRQISEHYYETADKLAARIAAAYLGKKVLITGTDLQAESGKLLQQMGAEITDEYDKELNTEPTQLRYDAITDHSRNEVVATDAAAQVLSDANSASAPPQ